MSLAIPYNPKLIKKAADAAGEFIWEKFPLLEEWINEEKKPTVIQLADFAKRANVPFGYFFLKNLPEKENIIPLFRTDSSKPVFRYSVDLQKTIDIVRMRQEWLAEFLKNEGFSPLPFVGVLQITDEIKVAANRIRNELKITENWAAGIPNRSGVFSGLIEKIEAKGIFIIVNGVVNNNTHRVLDRNEFQGFALCNLYAPFIFINGADYKAAQLFTLMHELVHIWLGVTAITDFDKMLPSNDHTEKFCNSVAAELLVPEDALKNYYKEYKNGLKSVTALSGIFKVSRIVIARRLLDLEVITRKEFFVFYESEQMTWERKKENISGGDFYLSQPFKISKAFFNTVDSAAKEGKLLYSDAYKLTSLYGNTYHTFSEKMQ